MVGEPTADELKQSVDVAQVTSSRKLSKVCFLFLSTSEKYMYNILYIEKDNILIELLQPYQFTNLYSEMKIHAYPTISDMQFADCAVLHSINNILAIFWL